MQNVEIALTLSGVSRTERRERAIKALEEVGLGDQLSKRPGQMSGGQMQRVAIARALVNNPDIILADEPTGNLDRKNGEEIIKFLKKSNRSQKQTLILITHDESIALQADRMIYLEDGKIVRNERIRSLGGGIGEE